MGNLDYKQFSERHRPHIHPPDSILFVTYRLAGSIPRATVREYKAKKEWLADQLRLVSNESRKNGTPESKRWLKQAENFNRDWFVSFEDIMHKANNGPMWMKDERVAEAVALSLQELDGNAYRLDAYSVMSKHVHAVFKPFLSEIEFREVLDEDGRPSFVSEHPSLPRIMHLSRVVALASAIEYCPDPGNFGSTKVLIMLSARVGSFKRSSMCSIIQLKRDW